MRVPAHELLAHVRSEEEAMCRLLVRLAEAESPSLDPSAQRRSFAVLAGELRRDGLCVRRIPGGAFGDHLYARPPARRRGSPVQLLVGHLDTVWPVGTLDEMPAVRDDATVRGPGVLDMKAGLVQIVFALRAVRRFELELPATPVVLAVADEEVGSPDSRRYLEALARCSCRAFLLEPAFGPGGALKTRRKAVGRFTVTIEGRSAHAGVSPGEGVSAILELSHQVQALFALNDPASGVTVNVGTIDGGLRPNVVAPVARATVDVRVPDLATAAAVEASLRALEPSQDGISLKVEGRFGRPPLEPSPRNRALWRQAQQIAAELGLPLEEVAVGGASDGNLTSRWTATLDGLGGVGEGAHAVHEHVVAARMPERAALLALLLARPVTGHPGGERRHAPPVETVGG